MKSRIQIIAEVGVNHDGKIIKAKKLIDVAKKGNADFVKFQLFKANTLATKNTKLVNYQKKTNFKSQYDLLKKLEISFKDLTIINSYAKKKKIKLLVTPFDINSLNQLIKIGIKIIKIPSGEIDNVPLLYEASKKAYKVILSTGMSNMKEISFALRCLTKYKLKKKNITILHCTSSYPTRDSDANINCITTIKNKFGLNVGYSDHTNNYLSGVLAATLGSKIIEKHITLNKKSIGPDHKSSFEPHEFFEYIKKIRTVEKLLGSNIKKPTKDELKTKKLVRKSIVAKSIIKKGDVYNIYNITCKRPQNGISSKYWNLFLGKKAKRNYKVNQRIDLN
tara:strand:+ start:6261 stop:7265 length:1005 start_codon:yes stop_codon:yes gene_type:complete